MEWNIENSYDYNLASTNESNNPLGVYMQLNKPKQHTHTHTIVLYLYIYIYIFSLSLSLSIYIYIYIKSFI